MSQEIKDIVIEENTIPNCPNCNGKEWIVKQKICRESNLQRVDGFRDLIVSPPDEGTYEQAIVLECVTDGCGELYQPQVGVSATTEFANAPEYIEAYQENTESYLDFPISVGNEVSYEEDD